MKSYSEKLKDPRWQKERLKIMSRDKFTCTRCGNTHLTLNVHHRTYFPNTEPWEYDEVFLTTLCDPCHDLVHEGMEAAMKNIGEAFKTVGFFPEDINEIASSVRNMDVIHLHEVVASTIAYTCKDEGLQNDAINNYLRFLMEKDNAKTFH